MVSVSPHMTTVSLSNTQGEMVSVLPPHDYSVAQQHTREKWSVSRPTWLQYRSATHQGEMVSVSPHMTTALLSNTPGTNGQCLAPHDYSIAQQHTREKWSVSHSTWPILLSNTPGRNGQCLAPHDYSIAQKHISGKWSVSRPTWPVSLSNTPWRNGQCLAPHDYSIAQQHTGRNGQCLAPRDYSIAQQHTNMDRECSSISHFKKKKSNELVCDNYRRRQNTHDFQSACIMQLALQGRCDSKCVSIVVREGQG